MRTDERVKIGPYWLGPGGEEEGIYSGDARELAKKIPDESVDLIMTDPPYQKSKLHLYQWLAEEAERVLKPGGFVLALCGGIGLDKIYGMFSRTSLEYYWQYNIQFMGKRSGIVWLRGNNHVPIVTRLRTVLAYSKGEGFSRCATIELIQGTKKDKRFHVWGQEERPIRYYIDCFSKPEDVVWDPFCGGGTTPAMCKIMHRKWLAFDNDEGAVAIARERVRRTLPPLFMIEAEQLVMDVMETCQRRTT